MKTFVLLILLFSALLHSQNMEMLFGKFLPESLRNDKENFRQAVETLRRDALLNPDLLFYRIIYYDMRFSKNENDNKKNGFEEIRSLVSQEINKKNIWLKEQINKVHNYKKRSDFVAEISEYFRSLHSNVVVDEEYSIRYSEADLKQIDYFASLYFSENPDLKLDKNLNYSMMKKNLEEEKRIDLRRLYKSLKDGTSNPGIHETEEQVAKFWYLFPIKLDDNKELDAYEILLAQLEREYSNSEMDKFFFLVGMRFYQIKEVSKLLITPSETSTELQVAEIYNKYNFVLQFGYRIFISESVRLFSYINTNVNLAVSFNPDYMLSDSIVYMKTDVIGNDFTSELWNFYNRDISKANITSLYFRASTPILFFGSNFSVEVGFIAGFSRLNCDFKYSFDYSKVRVDWEEQNGGYNNTLLERFTLEDKSESVSETTFRIYPSVDFNYYTLKPLILQLSAGYNFIEFKAGAGF